MKSHPFWHQLRWPGSAERGSQFFSFGGGRSPLRGAGRAPAPPGEGSLDPEAALAGAGPRREPPPRGGPGGAPRGKGRSAPSPGHGGRREKGSARRAVRASGGCRQGRRPARGCRPGRSTSALSARPSPAPPLRRAGSPSRFLPRPLPRPGLARHSPPSPWWRRCGPRAGDLWLETRKRREQLPAGRAGPGEPRGGN